MIVRGVQLMLGLVVLALASWNEPIEASFNPAAKVRQVDWKKLGRKKSDFARAIRDAAGGEPLLIKKSLVQSWPAMEKWTHEYFAEHANPSTKFAAKTSDQRRFSWACCQQSPMKMKDFIGLVQNSANYSFELPADEFEDEEPTDTADTSVFGLENEDEDEDEDEDDEDNEEAKKQKAKVKAKATEANSADSDEPREFGYLAVGVETLGEPFTSDIDSSIVQLHEIDGINPDLIEGELRSRIWIGSKGDITPLHCDQMHNLFVQISGRKKFTLIPPTQWIHLYMYPKAHLLDRNVRFNLDSYDEDEFPFLADVQGSFEVVLGPGDVLYLPPMYFHQVEALEPSISFNQWSPSRGLEKMNGAWAEDVPVDPSSDANSIVYRISYFISLVIRRVLGDVSSAPFFRRVIDSRYSQSDVGSAGESDTSETRQYKQYMEKVATESPPFLAEFGDFENVCAYKNRMKYTPPDVDGVLQSSSAKIASHFFVQELDQGSVGFYLINWAEDMASQIVGHEKVLPFLEHCVWPRVRGVLPEETEFEEGEYYFTDDEEEDDKSNVDRTKGYQLDADDEVPNSEQTDGEEVKEEL